MRPTTTPKEIIPVTELRIATIRAIHDALSLRGLDDGGGFLRTASPELYMDEGRLRLAREVLRLIPMGAVNVESLADKIEPVVARTAKPQPEPGPTMFFS